MSAKVRIDVQPRYGTRVWLDDVEVKGLTSVEVRHVAGQGSTVVLGVQPSEVEITGLADEVRRFASIAPVSKDPSS